MSSEQGNHPRRFPGDAGDIAGGETGGVIPGSLASLDSTLPPTPLKKLLAADGASVYVLSIDGALIQAVNDAAGEQYPVHTLAEWIDLVGLIEADRCKIVLLDADLVGTGLERRVKDLHNAGTGLVVLVAARRETAQGLIGLLSDRTIHRLLIKPAAVGITRLLLESAVSRYLQLRESAQQVAEEHLMSPQRRLPAATRSSSMSPWMLAVVLVSLLLGGLLTANFARFRTSDDSSSNSPTPTPVAQSTRSGTVPAAQSPADALADASPATGVEAGDEDEAEAPGGLDATPATSVADPADATGTVSDATLADTDAGDPASTPPAAGDSVAALLARASLAVEQDRLAEPAGDSALDHYRSILDVEPDHAEAAAGFAGVIETLFGRAETALLDGDATVAGSTLDQIRRHAPSSSRLTFLQAQLTALLNGGSTNVPDAETPSQAGASPQTSERASLLTLARTRIEQGFLIDPAGDSARDYVDRAAAIQSDDPEVLAVRTELADAVADSARLVLESGNIESASALVDEAFALGVDNDTLVQLDLDLAAALEARALTARSAMLARGVTRLDLGRLVTPADDSALYHLAMLREQAPDYPGLAPAWTRLTTALADNARTAIAMRAWDDADMWLAWLAQTGYDADELETLTGDAVFGRQQDAYLATATPASELERLQAGTIEYPAVAAQRGIEGWVELEFVVDTSGQLTEARVVAAEPEGVFDEAALEAMSGFRYAPFELDGRVYERLARLRIRFGLQ